MKNVIKAALVGGALVSATAFGQTINQNDLVIYMSSTSGNYFVDDTGIALSSVVNANGTLNTAVTSAELNSAASAAGLSSFVSDGGTISWTIVAVGNGSGSAGDQTVFTSSTSASIIQSHYNVGQAETNGLNEANFTTTDLQGGGSETCTASGNGGICNAALLGTPWKTAMSGNTAIVGTAGSGGSMTLFSATATSGLPTITSTGETISWSSTSGFTVTATATPLPAAAWLLGSGLLGLIGVGRRRRAA